MADRDIKRRNFLISEFFRANGLEVAIMGRQDAPLFVTADNIVLSCFAHGFELVFRNDGFSGKEVFRVKLASEPAAMADRLLEWAKTAKHRKIYLFTYNGMFLSRYETRGRKMPLFAEDKELAYYVFKRQKALEMAERFRLENIHLQVEM